MNKQVTTYPVIVDFGDGKIPPTVIVCVPKYDYDAAVKERDEARRERDAARSNHNHNCWWGPEEHRVVADRDRLARIVEAVKALRDRWRFTPTNSVAQSNFEMTHAMDLDRALRGGETIRCFIAGCSNPTLHCGHGYGYCVERRGQGDDNRRDGKPKHAPRIYTDPKRDRRKV